MDTVATTEKDWDRLRILSYCHCGWAMILAVFGCLFLVTMAFVPRREPPAFFGIWFTTPGGKIVIAIWIFAACSFLAGWLLAVRKQYLFCIALGSVSCIMVPFGTVLGVYTLMVLLRQGVRPSFDYKYFARP